MTQRDPERPPRFCTNCGAKTVPGVSHCPACGQALVKHDELARLWGYDPNANPADDTNIIDLYPEPDVSLQATTPFTQTRPFTPTDRTPDDDQPGNRASRSSNSGTLPGTRPATEVTKPPPSPRRRGPHGCLLGCFALLLIGAVGALLAWGTMRPWISERIEEEVAIGLANELRAVDQIPVTSAGRITLTEAEINRSIEENEALYAPLENPSVTIDEDEIAIRFKLYGVASTYRSGIAVAEGRLVVVDPSLSGPAGQIISADEIGAVFEREVAELLRRSGLEPTNVRLRDGSIAIATDPIVGEEALTSAGDAEEIR